MSDDELSRLRDEHRRFESRLFSLESAQIRLTDSVRALTEAIDRVVSRETVCALTVDRMEALLARALGAPR
jgi:hypothetical protein